MKKKKYNQFVIFFENTIKDIKIHEKCFKMSFLLVETTSHYFFFSMTWKVNRIWMGLIYVFKDIDDDELVLGSYGIFCNFLDSQLV